MDAGTVMHGDWIEAYAVTNVANQPQTKFHLITTTPFSTSDAIGAGASSVTVAKTSSYLCYPTFQKFKDLGQ